VITTKAKANFKTRLETDGAVMVPPSACQSEIDYLNRFNTPPQAASQAE